MGEGKLEGAAIDYLAWNCRKQVCGREGRGCKTKNNKKNAAGSSVLAPLTTRTMSFLLHISHVWECSPYMVSLFHRLITVGEIKRQVGPHKCWHAWYARVILLQNTQGFFLLLGAKQDGEFFSAGTICISERGGVSLRNWTSFTKLNILGRSKKWFMK